MADKKVNIVVSLVDKATSGFKTMSSTVTSGLSGIVSAATTATKYLSATAIALSGYSLKVAGDFEQWGVAFETMLGSKEKADAFMNSLIDFSKKTPFSAKEVVEYSKQLLAMSIAQDKVIPNMEALGNISAGVGRDKLPQLTLAFGQVNAAGKLTGNELRQFTEAGVPLLEELASGFEKSTAEVQKMVSEGKVGFSDVEAALTRLTTGNGRFADLMVKQSNTFLGVMSNIKDTFDQVANSVGQAFIDVFQKDLKNFSEALNGLDLGKIRLNVSLFLIDLRVEIQKAFLYIKQVFMAPFSWETYKAVASEFLNKLGQMFDAIKGGWASIQAFRKKLQEEEEKDSRTIAQKIQDIEKEANTKKAELIKADADRRKIANKTRETETKETILAVTQSEKSGGDDIKNIYADVSDYIVGKQNEAREEIKKSIEDERKEREQNAKEQKKQADETSREILLAGRDFAQNFESAMNSMVQNALFSKGGAAESVMGGLQGILGSTGAAFMGGALGGIVVSGLDNIIKGLFSSSRTKTVAEYAEESFADMVKNTNNALQNIGKERGTFEKQVDLLEELKDMFGSTATIPEEYLKNLGLSSGTTIGGGLQTILEKISATNEKERVFLENELSLRGRQSEVGSFFGSFSDRSTNDRSYFEAAFKTAQKFGVQETESLGISGLEGRIQSLVDITNAMGGNVTDAVVEKMFSQMGVANGNIFKERDYSNTTEGRTQAAQRRQAELQAQLDAMSQFTLDETIDTLDLIQKIKKIQEDIAKEQATIAQNALAAPGFSTGGIVGGHNESGDRNTVRVNSGEMILNRQQQQMMLKMLNGQAVGMSGGNITVNVTLDKQVLGKAIVDLQNLNQKGLL